MTAATLHDEHVHAWTAWRHEHAQAFLSRLDPAAERWTFQWFDDNKDRKAEALAGIRHGAPDARTLGALDAHNEDGAGVFVCINETDFKGRGAGNVQRIRAVFAELDGAPLEPVLAAPLEPHFVVQSSPGKWHVYYLCDDCPKEEFNRVQAALARRFDGDEKGTAGINRVLRLPGYRHRKGAAFVSRTAEGVGANVPPYPLATIIEKLGLELDPPPSPGGPSDPTTDRELREVIRTGTKGVHVAASKLASRLVGRGMAADDAIATLQGLFDACEWRERDAARWAVECKEIGRHVRSAAAKYRDRREATGDAQEPGPAPVDLLRPMAAPPLRVGDVPEVLAMLADVHARATGWDASIMLAAGIGAACAALSDDVRLCVAPSSGWFESARLWLAIVAGPGAGKSPGSKAMLAPIFAMHREGIAQWLAEHKDDDEPGTPPALYTSDATTEALAETLRSNTRGLLYFVDELESWLASHDAYRTGAGKDRGEWLRLYDGGPHQVNRIRRGAFFVPNWGCSLLSATTPAALRKLAPKLPDDGLLQRLLLVIARPSTMPEGGVMSVETARAAGEWDTTLRRLCAAPAGVVRLSREAREAFEDERADLHRLTLAFEDSHPSLASHMAKRAAMLARLALAFHALTADNVLADLPGPTMQQAARFLRRQERHAMAVYGSMLGADTGMALARDIARAILASRLDGFNRRELTPRCKAFRAADEPARHAALTLLGDCGWLTPDSRTLGHGAQWGVDPRVHELFAEHGEAARRRRELVRSRVAEGGE